MKPFQSLAVGGLIFAGLFSLPSLARDRPPESVRSATLRQVFRTVTGKNLPSAVRIRLRGRENSGVLGTVVDADGGILTKASELEKDKRIVCRLSDGRDLPAEVVATDEATDLALLKVEAKDLTPLEWRADGDPQVGDWVLTISNQDVPLAVGVVSVQQHPIAREDTRGMLGIGFENANKTTEISQVYSKSAAEDAGLVIGDRIQSIDGVPMKSADEVMRTMRSHKPGDKIELIILRKDKVLTFSPVLTSPLGEFQSLLSKQNQLGGRLSRRRDNFPLVVQHDTVLSPEDCGGPLLDIDGKGIGLNIARAGRTESYALTKATVLEAHRRLREKAAKQAAEAAVKVEEK